MKCGVIVRAVGCIDGALIDEAENYRPKRRMPAWIWAVPVACLCLVVALSVRHPDTAQLASSQVAVCFAGTPEHGYVNYRELAENGKVLITDELKDAFIESKDIKDCERVEFMVRIIDANGAGSDVISSVLGLSGDKREEFIRNGVVVNLSEKEIREIKGSPELALIIAPVALRINEEYLRTIDRDRLTVDITVNNELRERKDQYSDVDEWQKACNERTLEILSELSEEYGISIEDGEEIQNSFADYAWELDIETVARLFADERVLYIYDMSEV